MKDHLTENISQFAKQNNIQSFLQSMFIHLEEQKDYRVINSTDDLFLKLSQFYSACEKVIVIHEDYFIGITHWSKTHQHDFSTTLVYKNEKQSYEGIDFLTFIQKTCTPWINSHSTIGDHELFVSRVKSSIEETSKVLNDKWDDFQKLFSNDQSTFEQTEGLLPFGHYAHPYPKLQEKIDTSIECQFHRPTEVIWCLVHKSILSLNHAETIQNEDAINEILNLFCKDVETHEKEQKKILDSIPDNYFPYPLHSYQWEILKKQKNEFNENEILRYINQKKILISHKSVWYPTTSTRALYSPQKKWMLKFSLSLRITNSIRVLQTEEVKRGMQLTDVLNSNKGKELKLKMGDLHFKILEEPFFMALKKENSEEFIKESIVVFRENPFQEKETSHFSLATLNQTHPITNKTLLATYINQHHQSPELWFESYLTNVLQPTLTLQAEFGVYLGAHQQNLIVTLNDQGLIEKAYYRDCQGTGYNEFSYATFYQNETDSKNVLSTTFANQLIKYYFFINSTLGTIKSLCNQNKKLEEKLILRTTLFMTSYKAQLSKQENQTYDLSLLNELLNDCEITIKNNFICCLQNINENTIANPLAIYRKIKNPFQLDLNIYSQDLKHNRMCLPRFNGSLKEVHWDQFFIWIDPQFKYRYFFDSAFETTFYFIEPEHSVVVDNSSLEEALFNLYPQAKTIKYLSKHNKFKKTLHRNDFFQTEQVWENDIAKTIPLEYNLTEKGKIPKRPKYKSGALLYKRYVHQINKFLSIRVIDLQKDLETFYQWHHQPRVANFWELNKSKEELALYIKNGLSDPHQIPVIIEFDGEAVGYFEIYWTLEDRLSPFYDAKHFDRGIHLLIGNAKFLGKENTDAILKSVCHYIFLADPRTERIMGEPRVDNDKILKYLLLFDAWKKLKEFDFPHKRAALVECSRVRFFQGDYL